MMWDRVSKVAMMREVKVSVASTQTEGAPTYKQRSQSQGTETMEDDFEQGTITKAEAEEQDEIEGCGNVRRSKDVGSRREEDRLSLESGSSTPLPHKDSEVPSSPSPGVDCGQIVDLTQNC